MTHDGEMCITNDPSMMIKLHMIIMNAWSKIYHNDSVTGDGSDGLNARACAASAAAAPQERASD